ncbi:uncharacterized protein BP5553_02058 [Venustampulla echinocandica]|uniref:Uncharacterized protein n=1 Tax=Venustampulla echinocandica TaxID=2656787 RepID=A0A370U2S8_9HELO|nr:uncharacterized protein BP5553_02058 [Venustampulla echinocandica]RDL42079.1 hypothetical protein BP5553_02058 [Venustampulla echinocandica]
MPLLRRSTAFSHPMRYAGPSAIRQPSTIRNVSSTSSRFAQGYGNGEGHPLGENPQQQGSSNETKENLEHPGPPPPAEGQGKGAGPTKGASKAKTQSPGEASASSGGSKSKEAKETRSSLTAGEVGKSGGKHSSQQDKKEGRKKPPIEGNLGPEANSLDSAEVAKHNKEFAEGYDRAPKAPGTREVDSKGRSMD